MGNIYIGLEKAKGNVITFLDDDDLFSKDKLERVYDAFLKHDIGFYHNDCFKGNTPLLDPLRVKDEGDCKIIKNYFFHSVSIKRATFNMSSIAVKTSIISKYKEEFRKVTANSDVFVLLLALFERQVLFLDGNKLTFYRLHDKNVSYHRNLEKAINFDVNLAVPALQSQLKLSKLQGSPAGMRVINSLLFYSYTTVDILKKEKKSKLLKDSIRYFPWLFLTDSRLVKRVLFILMYLVGSKFPYKRLTRYMA